MSAFDAALHDGLRVISVHRSYSLHPGEGPEKGGLMFDITTKSIHLKFTLVLALVVGILFSAAFIAAYQLRSMLLRSTAQAVAEQVIAFRSWVAGTGVIWVNNLHPGSPDFLGRTNCGGAVFYSKNPALATRELSNIVAQSGVNATFRVTSDNYRNVNNQPDSFEINAIYTFKTNLAQPPKQQARFIETYEGDRYRYSIPIKVTEPCLRCHGVPSEAPKEVVEKYGSTRAFHYRAGDIRGIITVDLPMVSLFSSSPITNIYSGGLVLAAFLVNFLFLKRIIVDRIDSLRGFAEKTASGEPGPDLAGKYKTNSRDEIDQLYSALEQMRKNVKSSMDKVRNQ